MNVCNAWLPPAAWRRAPFSLEDAPNGRAGIVAKYRPRAPGCGSEKWLMASDVAREDDDAPLPVAAALDSAAPCPRPNTPPRARLPLRSLLLLRNIRTSGACAALAEGGGCMLDHCASEAGADPAWAVLPISQSISDELDASQVGNAPTGKSLCLVSRPCHGWPKVSLDEAAAKWEASHDC